MEQDDHIEYRHIGIIPHEASDLEDGDICISEFDTDDGRIVVAVLRCREGGQDTLRPFNLLYIPSESQQE